MKLKKLIVLCGKAKTGKTTTLLNLRNKANLIKHLWGLKRVNDKDFIGVFDIKGKKVGIASPGDSLKHIKHGFTLLKNCGLKIDIVVCTCHPSMIVDTISLYGKLSAIVVRKFDANNRDNSICEKEILKNI